MGAAYLFVIIACIRNGLTPNRRQGICQDNVDLLYISDKYVFSPKYTYFIGENKFEAVICGFMKTINIGLTLDQTMYTRIYEIGNSTHYCHNTLFAMDLSMCLLQL